MAKADEKIYNESDKLTKSIIIIINYYLIHPITLFKDVSGYGIIKTAKTTKCRAGVALSPGSAILCEALRQRILNLEIRTIAHAQSV